MEQLIKELVWELNSTKTELARLEERIKYQDKEYEQYLRIERERNRNAHTAIEKMSRLLAQTRKLRRLVKRLWYSRRILQAKIRFTKKRFWQPIEEAPRDGRLLAVMLHYTDGSFGVEIGRWDKSRMSVQPASPSMIEAWSGRAVPIRFVDLHFGAPESALLEPDNDPLRVPENKDLGLPAQGEKQ